MIKFLDELGNFKQNTLQNVKLFYILKQRTHTYYLNLFVRLNTISSYLGTLDVLWIKVLLKCKKNCYGCCNVAYVTEMFCHTCYTFFWIFLTFTVISFFLHLIIPFVFPLVPFFTLVWSNWTFSLTSMDPEIWKEIQDKRQDL